MNSDYPTMMLAMPLLRGFTRSGVQRLIDVGQVKGHAAGEQLCREGDPGNSVLLVLSGRLRAYIERQGSELALSDFGPGVILGDIAVLCGTPRAASLRAIEPSAVLCWTDKAFRTLILTDVLLSHRFFASTLRLLIEREKALVESLERRQLSSQSS